MTKTRDIYIDEKLNLLVVCAGLAEAVCGWWKTGEAGRPSRAGVMLEVEILEVKRSRMLELACSGRTS